MLEGCASPRKKAISLRMETTTRLSLSLSGGESAGSRPPTNGGDGSRAMPSEVTSSYEASRERASAACTTWQYRKRKEV
eukprot:3250144-Pleurochrysis_carterae.AAC.1